MSPIATVKDGVKETRQHEIDFVVNRGGDRHYIQSAFKLGTSAKREQERLSLKKSSDFFAKVVVTSGYGQPQRNEISRDEGSPLPGDRLDVMVALSRANNWYNTTNGIFGDRL